jgi:hypothetical protein
MYSMSERCEPSSISEVAANPSDLAGVEVARTRPRQRAEHLPAAGAAACV